MLTIAMAVLTCQVLSVAAEFYLLQISAWLLRLMRLLVLQAAEILQQNGSFLQG